MGLFDGALGDVAGSLLGGKGGDAQQLLGGLLKQFGGQGSNNALLAAAVTLVQQQGGLEGLLQKFQAGGLGDAVQSWIGSGANTPISGDQLEGVLGHEAVVSAATQAGVSPTQAKDGLAALLPELVNHFTPGGALPADSGALVSTVLGMLRG